MVKRIVLILLALGLLAGGGFLAIKYLRGSPEARLKRAERYFAEGDFAAARIEYLNVLRKDRGNARAFEQIAATWDAQGLPFEAIRFLRTAVELEPEDSELRRRLARNWYALGQFSEAREEALRILEKDPHSGDALLTIAQTSFTEEELQKAEELLEIPESAQSASSHLARALLAKRSDDNEAFRAAIEAAAAADPKSAEVELAWADYYRLVNDRSAQREALKNAANLSGPRDLAPLHYVRFLDRQDESAEARDVLEKLLADAPDYFPALMQLAEFQRQEEKYDEALDSLELVLNTDSTNPNATWMKAQVLLDVGKGDQAIKVLERLDNRTTFPLTKYNLARIYAASNDREKARTKLKEALDANPNYYDAALLLAELELKSGATGEAVALLEKLLPADPGNPKALLLLANGYGIQGQADKAVELYQRCAQQVPNSPDPHLAIGRIRTLQKRYPEARESIEMALRIAPADSRPLVALVELDLLEKDPETAASRIQASLGREETWTARFLEGRVLAQRGEWDLSRKALFRALELNPGSTQIYHLLVGTYLAERKPGEAISELEALLKINPTSIGHRMLIAVLSEQRGDSPKAAATYEEIIRQQPDFVPALNNLAYLSAQSPEGLEKAEDLARRANRIAPEDAAVTDTLGWILYQRGKFGEALPLLERSVEALGNNAEAQYHLGMVRSRMGLEEEAQKALALAAAATQPFPGQEEARKELALLRDPNRESGTLTAAQLEARLEANPKDASTLLQLAQLLEKQGQDEQALEKFEAVTQINPNLPAAWAGMARLYGGPLDQLEKGIEAGRKAQQLDSRDPAIAALLGNLALKRSHSGDALWAYGLLWDASRSLKSPQVRHDLARAAYLQGKVPEARESMQALLRESPDDPLAIEAKRFLSLTAPGEDGWKTLAPLAAQTLEDDPQNVPALILKARLEPAEALAIYEGLLKRYPDFALAKIRLAALYAREANRLKEAEALTLGLLGSHAEDPELTRVRGALAFRKGEAKLAIQLLEQSQQAAPLDAEGLFYLGMASLKDGRDSKGTSELRKALEAGLEPDLEREARTSLGLGSP